MATEIDGIELCDPRADLMAASPRSASIFFGFHDTTPWSPDGSDLLGLRLDPSWTDMQHTNGAAEICVWNPATGDITPVAQTRCWNFQQGARLQWLPDGTGRIAFNTVGPDGHCEGRLLDPATREEQRLEAGIHTVSPDGAWALTPDYAALASLWPAYGYSALAGASHDEAIKRIDLATGQAEVFVSLQQVLALWDGGGEGHFLTHPAISPDGQSVVFLHRFFPADGGSYSRLLACDAEGGRLRVLADEKVSHFDWLDNETLFVWARFTGAGLARMRASGGLNAPLVRPALNLVRRFTGRWKKRMLSESYFALPIHSPDGRRRFGWPDLDEDGHPMVARSHSWIVTDTYPDTEGMLTLILFNRKTFERVDVARFRDGTTSNDSDAKCDLHPRWNRAEDAICVDWCDGGKRRMVVIDVSQIVGGVT